MKAYNILIVEDEKEICDGVAIYLRNQGYNVFKANNGIEGLEIIEKEGMIVAFQLELVKKIDYEIYEIRSKISSNIQRVLYFHCNNNKYIVTHGFTKKTQKTPVREIQHAKMIKTEYEEEQYADNKI